MLPMSWHDFMSPVVLSLKVCAVSSILVFLLGIAAAWMLSRRSFRGKAAVETVFLLPLVLPPTVVGFILLVALGKRSFVGRFLDWAFAQSVVFTWGAAVIAAIVVAFPLVFQTMKAGFASVDRDLEDAARSMGASEWQVLRWITLPLARRSLAAGYLLGFARGLGEFGATLMIAGNIPHKTQTLPTAIYVAVESGNLTHAWWWAGTIVVISFMLMLTIGSRKGSDK